MSIEAGRAYFRQFGMEDRVQEFTVSSATVDLAAKALGVEGARIAKTLSFKTADGCMLILAAGDARIDNHKFKEKFHMKAKMLSADEVLELVGHPVGGVCPFGCKEGIPVYLDVSLQRFETVFPAVGSPSSAIELNLDELYKYSNALEWIDVCKLPARPRREPGAKKPDEPSFARLFYLRFAEDHANSLVMLLRLMTSVEALCSSAEVAGGRTPATPRQISRKLKLMILR